jgi:hypothetical protein
MHQSIRGAIKKFPEFQDIYGLVYSEFVPSAESVTSHSYVQVL